MKLAPGQPGLVGSAPVPLPLPPPALPGPTCSQDGVSDNYKICSCNSAAPNSLPGNADKGNDCTVNSGTENACGRSLPIQVACSPPVWRHSSRVDVASLTGLNNVCYFGGSLSGSTGDQCK